MKNIRSLVVLAILGSSVLCWGQETEPEFTGPGWFRPAFRQQTQVPAQNWSEASEQEPESGLGPQYGPPPEAPQIAEAITPELEALARGLENDPKQIFDYVHDHIRYVHYFGSKKGAQLTLLERSGNDFDQCALLVALLRAAGHTASYRFGTVYMPYEADTHRDFKHWVGLTRPNTNWNETGSFVRGLNLSRGFPFLGSFDNDSNDLVFHHVWVRLTWNNTTYSLDPAFKVSEPIPGITNLPTAMGLDTNLLMTVAGGNRTTNYVEGVNEPDIRNKLRDWTTNLLGFLDTNCPNATVEQVLGGSRVVSSAGTELNQPLPFTPYLWSNSAPAVNWNYIPTNLMSSLRITVDTTASSRLLMPQLQGQKLSLTFSADGLAQLRMDDDYLLLQKQTGGSTVEVAVNVDHPHGSWDWVNNALVNTGANDQTTPNTCQAFNAWYVIAYAFEPDLEWLRQRQQRLDRYRHQGLADSSREVLTETLNIMGLSWLLQTERIPRLVAAQQDMLLQHHHRFGRMAQESGRGYYIDINQQLNGLFPANGASPSDSLRCDRVFEVSSYFASAAAHALIEQLQASGLVAASTIKMVQIGNTNNQRICIANSANWAAVQAELTNYDKLYFRTNFIDRGYTLLMPANGSNTVAGPGTWAGYGIVARGMVTNAGGVYNSMQMLISGGYNGGYSSQSDATADTAKVQDFSRNQSSYVNPAPQLIGTPFGADIVSMADGSFRFTPTGMWVGQPEPRGIRFSASYSSSRRFLEAASMSPGWTHNYDIRVVDVSAPMAGLGDTTPAQMAPMIVATRAAFELYATKANPKTWTVTALVAKWGLDRLINNAVSVTFGADMVQFIKQPSGTYTPPAGSTMVMWKTNNAYRVQQRHGNTFRFSTAGRLTNIVDRYSQPLTVNYDSSNRVQTVIDWKNRATTFTYLGAPPRLHSVSNSAGNFTVVLFYYNANRDISSAVDPENKSTVFTYDTNHQITSVKDPLNRLTVSNRYDGFGRVIEQYSKGDTNQTWQLFWSGFLNTEKDPAGGRRQYRFDDKCRFIQTQDAMGHYTDFAYDGQDHLTDTWSHLWAHSQNIYDHRHNLCTNIDALGYTNRFIYDNQDNLVQSVDARGNTNRFGYNARFQLSGSTNAAGDWVTYAYSPDEGVVTNRTDAAGAIGYWYDAYRLVMRITHPNGLGVEGFLNSARGDLLCHTNARGFVTTFYYNKRHELTNTIAPTNLTTRVVFDAAGNVQSATDARGFTTTNTWSATRKLLSTTLPATPQGLPVISNVYDSRDWLLRTTDPQQSTIDYANDAAQRLISVTDPLLRATRFAYDEDNRKIWSTNGANEATHQVWNARGELLQVTDPANHTVLRDYDGAGNQVLLTNRNGKAWRFLYDAANRLTNTITPLGRETKQIYNNRGLLQTVIEPSTETANLYYDARGRLTNRTDAVGTVFYSYDPNNNLTNVNENGFTNSWTFDAYDRVSSYKDSEGNLIQYRSDANGNLTNLIYPGGKVVTYYYDSLNRLTNVTDWANRKTSIIYDLASRVRSITRPNGTVREMNYDAAGQATNIVEKTASGSPIALFKFRWNDAARIEWEFAAPLPARL